MRDFREALMVGRNSEGRLIERPLSPHLQVYRPQITSVLSILHRITGMALALGALLLVWWLVAAASSDAAFAVVEAVLGSIPGRIVLFGFTLALFFHLFNGVRHLVWDMGWGFEIRTVEIGGWVVVGAALAFTLVSWIIGLAVG